jgi:DNA mismatch repair protein MutS
MRVRLMSFQSILFPSAPPLAAEQKQVAPPGFVRDLNLDQVIDAITTGKEEYNLQPVFYAPLQDIDIVTFRQQVMQDLDGTPLFDNVRAFAEKMRTMRQQMAQGSSLRNQLQKERLFLNAVCSYCDAVLNLNRDLAATPLNSQGLLSFREYLNAYAASERFSVLAAQANSLIADLRAIRYSVLIDGLNVQVRLYDDEPDYSREVEATFEKFKQDTVTERTFRFYESPDVNHVEAEILARVAQLYESVFSAVAKFYTAHQGYLDQTIVNFDRDIQFYVGPWVLWHSRAATRLYVDRRC